ncbi:hypothetical protein [uncultured Caulobacter sp.]|jgi:hypothetical protein|uniref:hypothetical protein n=1 Tax=uncultured Caulobacter sp. TaxID=158749 RepID=UPI00261F4F29|nr:hypothetical protein [uncultured Caulobacter sp.]
MVSTSDEGILAEYMVSYWSMKHEKIDRPTKLLETLHIVERYRAGENLQEARSAYDHAIWNGVPVSEMDQRLADLDQFMRDLVRERAAQWGQPH